MSHNMIFNYAIIKEEPVRDNEECDAACGETEAGDSLSPHCSDERVKQEPADLAAACDPADLDELYAGHEVKEEMVIGPVVLQPLDACASLVCRAAVPTPAIAQSLPAVAPYVPPSLRTVTTQNNRRIPGGTSHTLHFSPFSDVDWEARAVDSMHDVFRGLSNGVKASERNRQQLSSSLPAQRTLAGQNTHSCHICKKLFSRRSTLTRHQRIHSREKPYTCDICEKNFNRKGTLFIHLRTHTGEKPFSCDICKKEFNYSSALTRHGRTHTREKPFSCDICKKQFHNKSDLTRHQRIHTGEKPFSCHICMNQFNRNSHLIEHLQTHTGEKPFLCDICKKQFTTKRNLNVHLRTHTGEKPFLCDVCKKQFTTKRNLNVHLRTHTGEKPLSCDICKRQFNEKSAFTRHQRTIHKALK